MIFEDIQAAKIYAGQAMQELMNIQKKGVVTCTTPNPSMVDGGVMLTGGGYQ